MAIWTNEIKEIERLYESLKGQLTDLEKELKRLIKADDENMILLYSRRCLEVIITDLCECELKRPRKTEPLKGIIDKLHKEEKVPSHIISSMHGLNELSTYGAHPKDFDPEQLKPVLINLGIVIKWYLKYKKTGTDIKTKPVEEIGQNIKSTADVKKRITNPGKSLIGIVSMIILLLMAVIAVLFLVPKLAQKAGKQTAVSEIIRKAIAVLPVSNLTGNPDLEYIADGIQDDITGKLGTIGSLDVRPRSSTLQFKGSTESVQQMAKKLSVNNMIESSIKGSENNLQIEVRLIEAFPEERYIWNASFMQSWDKIGEIYLEILNHVIDGTKIKLSSKEAKNLSIVQKHNPNLLKACAKGKYYMNKLTAEDFERGLKFYNEAIAFDPSDPLPYIGLALGYSTAGHVSTVAGDAANRAIAYARQALSLDSTITEAADAYVVLATKSLYTDYDFQATARYLERAMELNPNKPMVHYHYGWLLMVSNKVDEAIAEFKKAIEIDPIDPTFMSNLAGFYIWIGRYKEALPEVTRTFELDPNNVMGLWALGSAYAEMGRYNEAIEAHKKGIAVSPDFEHGLGIAYARAGQKDKALEVASKLEKTNNSWYAWGIAEIYATLGDKDKAIYWIEEAYKQRTNFVPWFNSDAYFRPLYNDPRFKEIMSRLNFPE
jgi:tetratricopeptide (TPR) repeat protein